MKLEDGIKIYSIDKEQEEMIIHLGNLNKFHREYKELKQENQQLKEKINQYENPEDLTLFYMWIDEKAKDKMKELQQRINEALEYIKYCQTSDDDIYPVIEAEKMIELLKGEENE